MPQEAEIYNVAANMQHKTQSSLPAMRHIERALISVSY